MKIKLFTDGAVKSEHLEKVYLGWGFVALQGSRVLKKACGKVTGEQNLLNQRNVAAEMVAVIRALTWLRRQIRSGKIEPNEVEIIHDYRGCSAWPLGRWKANNVYTRSYTDFVQKCMGEFNIKFTLIKGHSGNEWNDEADRLAKAGALKAYMEDNHG